MTVFSCLGETLWYLSGSDSLKQIEYYIPKYRDFISAKPDTERAPGAYGPRLFGTAPDDQIARMIATLKGKLGNSDTRQAVVQIFNQSDLVQSNGDMPCTTTLQFLPRTGKLHMVTAMRSNDAYRGLPHDVFAFTFIQELLARSFGLSLGTYRHFVASMHLYEDDVQNARKYLAEGFQMPLSMPEMPLGDPFASVSWLLKLEQALRLGQEEPIGDNINPYWADLAQILRIQKLYTQIQARFTLQGSREIVQLGLRLITNS